MECFSVLVATEIRFPTTMLFWNIEHQSHSDGAVLKKGADLRLSVFVFPNRIFIPVSIEACQWILY